jgi:hypothetical protein
MRERQDGWWCGFYEEMLPPISWLAKGWTVSKAYQSTFSSQQVGLQDICSCWATISSSRDQISLNPKSPAGPWGVSTADLRLGRNPWSCPTMDRHIHVSNHGMRTSQSVDLFPWFLSLKVHEIWASVVTLLNVRWTHLRKPPGWEANLISENLIFNQLNPMHYSVFIPFSPVSLFQGPTLQG